MKKAYTLILALLLLVLTGCAASKDITDTYEKEDTSTSSTSTTTTNKLEDNPDEKMCFDENIPLFICQDRADIEGDRDALYYYNYKGEQLENAVMHNVGFFGENGLAPAFDPATEKIGFVDKSGVFVIDPQWDDATAFSKDDIALVIIEKEDAEGIKREKYGYIDGDGKQIVECIYDDATSFYPQGVAIVGISKETEMTYTNDDGEEISYTGTSTHYGVIDKTGSIIIQPEYKYIYNVENNYILCIGERAQALYDLSGKAIVTEEECEKNQYVFYQECGTLHRWKTEFLTEEEQEKNGGYPYRDTDFKVFNGKEFIEDEYDPVAPFIHYNRVATTQTGYGYGVVKISGSEQEGNLKETVLIPYEYDQIIKSGSYYIAIKYKDVGGDEQSFDIYNSNFEKTAENIDYKFNQSVVKPSLYGDEIVLPDGYFKVYYYNEEIGETVFGIVNEQGETIVPVLFYRPIKLFVYECVGGKFMDNRT